MGKMRALALHDHIVARRLKNLVGKIDVIHTYAVGSLETLKAARSLGIPTVLERTNAHTRFAFEAVNAECARLGIVLPPNDEYFYRKDVLRKEEEEYQWADYILCPSDFVVKSFMEYGFPQEKLVRNINGVDDQVFFPDDNSWDPDGKFTMVFVGVCAVRKGLHFALDAWLRSPASRNGQFLIVGDFLPAYAEKLSAQLSHPSVQVLGHIKDVPGLMRKSHVLVLPSIEEGFARVVTEAMASGCVPLASDACTEICRHMETGMVHRVGDVAALCEHITALYEDRCRLERLRRAAIERVADVNWTAAGKLLVQVYRHVIADYRGSLAQAKTD
jgi:glycosyltransferase involved in cell wall biosynthesis